MKLIAVVDQNRLTTQAIPPQYLPSYIVLDESQGDGVAILLCVGEFTGAHRREDEIADEWQITIEDAKRQVLDRYLVPLDDWRILIP